MAKSLEEIKLLEERAAALAAEADEAEALYISEGDVMNRCLPSHAACHRLLRLSPSAALMTRSTQPQPSQSDILEKAMARRTFIARRVVFVSAVMQSWESSAKTVRRDVTTGAGTRRRWGSCGRRLGRCAF